MQRKKPPETEEDRTQLLHEAIGAIQEAVATRDDVEKHLLITYAKWRLESLVELDLRMKVIVKPFQDTGTQRFTYNWYPNRWALPLYIGLAKSWFPSKTATLELDDRWILQRVLIVRVLCFEMEVVLSGPLIPVVK